MCRRRTTGTGIETEENARIVESEGSIGAAACRLRGISDIGVGAGCGIVRSEKREIWGSVKYARRADGQTATTSRGETGVADESGLPGDGIDQIKLGTANRADAI